MRSMRFARTLIDPARQVEAQEQARRCVGAGVIEERRVGAGALGNRGAGAGGEPERERVAVELLLYCEGEWRPMDAQIDSAYHCGNHLGDERYRRTDVDRQADAD